MKKLKLFLLFALIPMLGFGQITLQNSGNDINVIRNARIVQGFHKSGLEYSYSNITVNLKSQGQVYSYRYADIDVPVTANIGALMDTLSSWIGNPVISVLESANGNQIEINDSGQLKVVLDGMVDDNNSSAVSLAGDGVFTGWASSTLDYALIFITVYSDVISATDGLMIQQSSDSTNWDIEDNYTIPAASGKTFSIQPSAEYFRIVYTNGNTIQAEFRLQSILKKTNSKPSSHRVLDSVSGNDDAELVKAILTGLTPSGSHANVNVTNGQNLKMSLEELESGISSNSNSQLNVTPYFSDGVEVAQVDGKIRTSSVPYTYDIAKGNIAGHFPVFKFGVNQDVGQSEETIWTEGGLYNWDGVDAAGGIVKVSSTVEDDSTNGTGARTCTIYGLSSIDSTAINETLNLDGQTAVNSSLSYYRVNRIIINTAGSSKANEGKVYVGTGTVTTGTPAVKWAVVEVGKNQTLMSVWTVPMGQTFFLTSFLVSTDSNKGDDINMYFRPPNELFQIKFPAYLFASNIPHSWEFPLMLPEGTDIDCRAIGIAAGAGIAITFEGWYE